MKLEVLSSEIVMKGRIFDVRKDHIRYQNGHKTDYDVIVHSGAVTLIPIDTDGNVWFVRQYRHAIGETLLELPAGTLEEKEGPKHCAERELREEIGYSAGKLRNLGGFYLAPGYSNEYMNLFLATDLQYDPLQPDQDENLQTESYSSSDVISMLTNSEFQDAKTIAGLYYALPYLSSK